MVDSIAILIFETRSTVRHQTLSLRASNHRTEIGLWALTEDARRCGALWRVAWNHTGKKLTRVSFAENAFDKKISNQE